MLTAVEKPFRIARRKAKLPEEMVLYSSRHTFATDLLDRTGNLKLVADVLGHGSTVITAKYLHPAFKQVAGIVDQRNEAWRASASQARFTS